MRAPRRCAPSAAIIPTDQEFAAQKAKILGG
jgi:hypothetical protein